MSHMTRIKSRQNCSDLSHGADIDEHELAHLQRLTQRETAVAHGVASRTIRRWTELGMPRRRDGAYSLPQTIRWRTRCAPYGYVLVEQARRFADRDQQL
jgi:hypothetical protein